MFFQYLMSDKRATYAIGTVVAAVALVFGLITAVPAVSTVSLNSVPLGMIGHAEVVLKDLDGNIKAYRQTDNVVVKTGKNCAADLIFGQLTNTGLCNEVNPGTFDDIRIGSSTVDPALNTHTRLLNDLGTGGQGKVNPGDGTGVLTAETDATTSASGALKEIVGTFTLTATASVGEVGLFIGDDALFDDEMFSRIVLDPVISAGDGDTVTITYVIEVG